MEGSSSLNLSGPGCSIPRCEERGISILQLRGVMRHIVSNALQWIDDFRFSSTYQKALEPDKVNLYQLCTNLLKPATAILRCSFVELIAQEPQPPCWFVSHWWGEPVHDFVICVEAHARLRHLCEQSAYWVCAYANNQWALGSEVTADPAQTSFRKAMALAQGTLSILDTGGITFTRIWCGFEIATTLSQDSQKLYDISTMLEDKSAVLITDGLTAEDRAAGEAYGPDYEGGPRGHQSRREQLFPLALAEKALGVQVEKGSASVPSDKTHILNSIAGRPLTDLDNPPLETCQRYMEVNQVLHGRFAAALYRVALESQWTRMHDTLQPALLQNPCSVLALSFHECPALDERSLAELFRALPTGLQQLELDFTFCSFGFSLDAADQKKCRKKKSKVKHDTKSSGDDGAQFACLLSLDRLTQLVKLSLNFSRCWGVTALDVLGSISTLKTLRHLSLEFNMCLNMSDISDLQSLESLPDLADLCLDLSSCSALHDFSVLEQLKGCTSLLNLSVNLSGSAVSTLTKKGGYPSQLAVLKMDFTRCLQLSDAAASLVQDIACIKTLQYLSLNFSLCEGLREPLPLEDLLKLDLLKGIDLRVRATQAAGAFPPERNTRNSNPLPQNITSCAQLRDLALGATSRSSGSVAKPMECVLAAFNNCDSNNDGIITIAELKVLFCKLNMEEKDVDMLLQVADTNKDGVICYREFLAWLDSDDQMTDAIADTIGDDSSALAEARFIFIGNTAKQKGNRWSWTFYIRGDTDSIESALLHLHPSFPNPEQKLSGPVLERTFSGWGTFPIDLQVFWKAGGELRTTWELQFHADASKRFLVPRAQHELACKYHRPFLTRHEEPPQTKTAQSSKTNKSIKAPVKNRAAPLVMEAVDRKEGDDEDLSDDEDFSEDEDNGMEGFSSDLSDEDEDEDGQTDQAPQQGPQQGSQQAPLKVPMKKQAAQTSAVWTEEVDEEEEDDQESAEEGDFGMTAELSEDQECAEEGDFGMAAELFDDMPDEEDNGHQHQQRRPQQEQQQQQQQVGEEEKNFLEEGEEEDSMGGLFDDNDDDY